MSNAGRKKRMGLGMDIAEQWGTGTSNARAEHILTINIITILFTGLHAVDFVDTPAYALILLPENIDYANLGGPAPCVAPTPQKRGPLLTRTLRRGRLPSFWVSSHLGTGPKLLLTLTSFQYMNFINELATEIRKLGM